MSGRGKYWLMISTEWARSHRTRTQYAPKISLNFHSTTLALSIQRSPTKSTLKRPSEIGVPRSRRNHMKKGVKVKPNRPIFANELSDADMERRCDSCHPLWYTYPSAICSSMILSVTNVPPIAVSVTEMWCSGQRRLPILSRIWKIILRV